MDTVEDPFEGQYLAWNTGEPNNYDGHENCVHMYAQGSLQGKWNDIRCNLDSKHVNRAPVAICQKPN